MTTKKEPMNIIFCSSQMFSEPTAVTLYSLLKSNPEDDLNIFVMDCGIEEQGRRVITNVLDKYSDKWSPDRITNLEFIDANELVGDFDPYQEDVALPWYVLLFPHRIKNLQKSDLS